MNIAAIQTFLSVVRTRNLNRAAEELNITQSAVTARLDALDQALGTRLLIRSRKGAMLTKAGFGFLEQAEVITRTWENARSRANLPRGVIRLFSFVCDPGLWTGLGQNWIRRIRDDHPETAIEIWSGLTGNAQSWLQSGMSDAALLTEPLVGTDFDSREFTTDSLIQVATRQREAVRWDPDYIYVDYGATFRAQHAEAWPTDETASVAFSSPDWALAHLLSEGGSAYLPRRMVTDLIAEGALFRVENAVVFERRTFLSWRKGHEDNFPWLASSGANPKEY
ncbi:LysR family transcriptional regulator [Ruegeria arenilitoris]|uniref:LysR family transcriptional regulator n=1 Tax=Ruegeria arenilitoris TaxID=1173585 RepID=UPI00147DC0F7|nr:LysR family transcriptional regulator [Ruegeria arenilitoris]